MLYLFRKMMRSIFRIGHLTIIEPDGTANSYGDDSGTEVVVAITDQQTMFKLLVHSDLYLGKTYVDGTLVLERGSIYDLLALATDNLAHTEPIAALEFLKMLRSTVRRLQEYNPVGRARQNVAHHYDFSGRLCDLFLDRDRARQIYDEHFCRMWEFYLAGSECSFRFDFLNNFQIQMTRDRHALPLTRDYIAREEQRLRRIDSKCRQLASGKAR